ncbi:MAG: XTP/dITP diphosphatase [Lachnospiraceae bacterium]|nr:XTP/dITP diphosphatase [Lachnospiraceae bacterium]
MKRIIFATSNPNKLREIRQIFDDPEVEILSLKEAGIHADIVEDGTTFEENACIKAGAVSRLTGELVLADDSGLEVDYLDRAPGVYSARFMGEETPYSVKNQFIIDQLRDAEGEKRSARFVCAIAAAFPDGRTLVTRGTIEGRIAYEPAGMNGFGYDPIVFVPEFGMTTGEMEPEQKNAISHRGKALRQMRELLKKAQ